MAELVRKQADRLYLIAGAAPSGTGDFGIDDVGIDIDSIGSGRATGGPGVRPQVIATRTAGWGVGEAAVVCTATGVDDAEAVDGASITQDDRWIVGIAGDFQLALDVVDGSLRRAFGVSDTLGLIPKRVTFVIDRQGVIRHRFSALFAAEPHVREALAAVRALV